MKKYEFLEHTADIKFRVFGKDMEGIFENTVLAVSEILRKGNKIKSSVKKSVRIDGKDNEKLLYSLVDEMLYLLDAEKFITSKAKVKTDSKGLTVEFLGDSSEKYR